MWGYWNLGRVAREALTWKVSFELGLERSERASYETVWEKNILDIRNSSANALRQACTSVFKEWQGVRLSGLN